MPIPTHVLSTLSIDTPCNTAREGMAGDCCYLFSKREARVCQSKTAGSLHRTVALQLHCRLQPFNLRKWSVVSLDFFERREKVSSKFVCTECLGASSCLIRFDLEMITAIAEQEQPVLSLLAAHKPRRENDHCRLLKISRWLEGSILSPFA